ncbi:N-fatty-acyl-amino acid synthase/hydrolase PM20D1.2 isoform X2 [Carassius gibelio]|uniref:N-fatty-acyl-amino acid synthase/hydrolase PM20D1.2 isoform X2 n=1 Tax=Carassius gibelio TaxID=101364 RepID=UPI002278A13B|nr:N-fatty-acyl-amino acid synthase/hydrolase PM20D1.2 isoform X2 [Carassius gibelio]
MTGQNAEWKLFKFLKVLLFSVIFLITVLFLVATVKTFTFDADAGLLLGKWENTTAISLHLSPQQRKNQLAHFKAAIQIPTVSFTETNVNTSALREFDALLRKVFPKVFSSSVVQHEMVGSYSHLLTVSGSEADLEPYMLLAHIDVVPADEADGWDAPPFSAQEINGFIYGRGTIDNKQSVMGILQALEYLLERGYTPRRSFYIGLGHDEEVNGLHGAVNIVKLLKSRGVKLQYVLDEGLAVLDGVISGLDGPAALIGISEKGQATVKLSVSSAPGHSSMPPRESSIGILASAVKRLEENPMPRLFGYGPERGMFEHLAHKFGLPLKFIMSNLWLFSPLLSRVLERKPDTNAFVRTTTAVTMFNSGVKVLELVESTVSDERVKVELVNGFDPLPISSYDEQAFGFQIIKKTVQSMFPQLTVAPGVCVGNTDSRHYKDITQDIYRFAPSWFKPGDPQRFHGVNERISIQNYEEIVQFYFQLIQNNDIRKLPPPHSSQHEL